MTKIEIIVPQLSESTTEATIIKWYKKVGDTVKKNENLIDIETDKIVLEIPSPENGIITKILKKNGENVVTNEIIGILNTEINLKEKNKSSFSKKIENFKKINNILKIKKKNQIKKLNLKDERIKRYVPMSKLRIKIAERLLKSQSNNAILTTFNEINMQPIIDIRNKYKDSFEKKYKIKLGFMSFFVKAVIYSLKKFPIINASINENNIVYHDYYDIGIAISSNRGLIVPILRNAEKMSIIEIETKIKKFIKNAENGKLLIEQLTGGTFTISNGGVFGSMLSTPIINPPQSAILGIHKNQDRVIVENKKIVIRPINYFALSYDHRIIDGKDAILSLIKIKEALENPFKMLIEI